MAFDRRRFLQLLAFAGAVGLSRAGAVPCTPSPRVYRCGDCPFCGPAGDLILLKALRSGRLFVFCPHCGVAFDTPDGLDPIQTPDDLAPTGFVLAGADDVQHAAREGWAPNDEGPVDEWWIERLGPGLQA